MAADEQTTDIALDLKKNLQEGKSLYLKQCSLSRLLLELAETKFEEQMLPSSFLYAFALDSAEKSMEQVKAIFNDVESARSIVDFDAMGFEKKKVLEVTNKVLEIFDQGNAETFLAPVSKVIIKEADNLFSQTHLWCNAKDELAEINMRILKMREKKVE